LLSVLLDICCSPVVETHKNAKVEKEMVFRKLLSGKKVTELRYLRYPFM